MIEKKFNTKNEVVNELNVFFKNLPVEYFNVEYKFNNVTIKTYTDGPLIIELIVNHFAIYRYDIYTNSFIPAKKDDKSAFWVYDFTDEELKNNERNIDEDVAKNPKNLGICRKYVLEQNYERIIKDVLKVIKFRNY